MMIPTSNGAPISSELLVNYFKNLVNQFFKILPIRESGEGTLQTYIISLQTEMIGCQGLVLHLQNNALYITLLSILQYLIDHPECSVRDVKREVFKAINICNRIGSSISESEVTK